MGCEPQAPKFPTVPVYETAKDPQSGEYLCGEYRIKDPVNFTFEPVLDHPISQCEGVFGFKTKDFPTVIEWMKSVEAYYKKKLEECK